MRPAPVPCYLGRLHHDGLHLTYLSVVSLAFLGTRSHIHGSCTTVGTSIGTSNMSIWSVSAPSRCDGGTDILGAGLQLGTTLR